jgi:toxin-antitoxin system PIN domain toxin
MFVVDTNVLLHAADTHSPFHGRCDVLLETWRNQPSAWFTTWGVCYEFLRVATHPAVFRSPWSAADAWSFLEALFDSPGLDLLVPTERHRAVANEVLGEIPYLAGNIMHDAHTAILMREHGVKRIYTRDTDFHRFAFLEPVDPMQA